MSSQQVETDLRVDAARPDPAHGEIDYYDQRWSQEYNSVSSEELLRLSRLLWAFTLLAQKETGKVSGTALQKRRICDLGCGTGWISSLFTALGEVTAVDYSEKGIDVARQRFPQVSFVVDDVTKYRSDKAFDVVLSTEVIEHVPDKRAFVETCRDILTEGGCLVLTCPNGRYRDRNTGGAISNQPIEEWPTMSELRSLLAEDFEVLHHDTFRVDYFHSGMNRLANSYKVRRLVDWLKLSSVYDALLGRMGLGLYQLVVARKKPAR